MTNAMRELSHALTTGYLDSTHASKHILKPELLFNDGQGRKVLTGIRHQLNYCDRFWFSTAFVTTSGVACIKQELIELEKKGVQGKILVSQYLNFTQPAALRELIKFSNIEVKIATESSFHAKGYLFGDKDAHQLIIGSSNLTASALTTNKEWNLRVATTDKGAIYLQSLEQFEREFEAAVPVTEKFISDYEALYTQAKELADKVRIHRESYIDTEVKPNNMQKEALSRLSALRHSGANKALLISATGTGKTYLSAFDALQVKPKRLLFIVHRANIAKKAMETFQKLFPNDISFGLYSGAVTNSECDFVFSTVQTLSRDEHLNRFATDCFDYIVIDETHRVSAKSYQKILDHFEAGFLLGMTATPERTDDSDIYKTFDHNVAYEIRLQQALEMDILSPFHYYGVTDLMIDGESVDDVSALNFLVREERVKHVLQQLERYGCDNGKVRGLVFCSNIKECKSLATAFNANGLRSIALTGEHNEAYRDEAISRLESDNEAEKLDYIFSVGIFNEGIDIPSVNQIVMLRPTESAIIFVQQLGRGLRKADNKEYLTVIDFIGNYKNNFMVPIALYGDRSYNKDNLRRLVSGDDCFIPGSSSVSFDKISKERIYDSIDNTNLRTKRDLVKDYNLLKYKLGYVPMMMDFIEFGSRDPFAYVEYAKSYYHFAKQQEESSIPSLDDKELDLLAVFSKEINNAKRVEESIILKGLLEHGTRTIYDLSKELQSRFGLELDLEVVYSAIHNLNLRFVTVRSGGKNIAVGDKLEVSVVNLEDNTISWNDDFSGFLKNDTFVHYLRDSTEYAITKFSEGFHLNDFRDGFQLYRKYSRKDVFRLLGWSENPNPQNVGGYMVSKDKSNCPIFVNYHKADDITDTTKYEDHFINESTFSWMSKSKRTLNSPEIKLFASEGLIPRLPLFIKKHNDEGNDFYYMGDMVPQRNSFEQTHISNTSVVKIVFDMADEVRQDVYSYIVEKS